MNDYFKLYSNPNLYELGILAEEINKTAEINKNNKANLSEHEKKYSKKIDMQIKPFQKTPFLTKTPKTSHNIHYTNTQKQQF